VLDDSFADLLSRVRTGDERAAAEVARRYEPEIRREVRLRLRDPRLRRVFDSMDICQSVLASFFARAGSGGFELGRREDLIGLLMAMTRNKLVRRVRHERAHRRDGRRLAAGGPEVLELIADEPSPSRLFAGAELLQEVSNRLSVEERQLAEWRAEGRRWSEIVSEVGGTAEGRRKQLARALGRVVHELGLDEESHE